MRKTGIIFFLTTALFLVLGHSVFPHDHISGVCCSHCISIRKSLSLTDIITNALTQDLGDNHLEEYQHHQLLGFDFTNIHGSFVKTNFSFAYLDFLWDRIDGSFSNSINSQFSDRPSESRAPPIFF